MIQMLKNKPLCLNFSKGFFERQLFFRDAYIQGEKFILKTFSYKRDITLAVKIKKFKEEFTKD